jgi:hypothetical protein
MTPLTMRAARACLSLLLLAAPTAGCDRCGRAPPPPDPAAAASPPSTPSTPPIPPTRVRLIVGGDSRDDRAHVLPWAFGQAKARGAAAFLFLGAMELTPQLDQAFARELRELDPLPFYPVLGNHEIEQLGFLPIDRDEAERALARRFLGTSRTPVQSALPGRVVYSVDLPAGVHFVALDNVSQDGFGREQLAWLADDLSRARGQPSTRYLLVGMHKPLARSGVSAHGMDGDGAKAVADSEAALRLMVDNHVDLILASHVHQFSQVQQAGILTYVTGGLGAPLRRSGPEHAFHHFLQLDVTESGIHVDVVRFPGAPVLEGEGDDD